MMLKETLAAIARSQKEDLSRLEAGVERERLAEIDLQVPFAIVISGVRRCGKSTLLRQLMAKNKFCYFNFEDPRVTGFEVADFQKLVEVLADEYGSGDTYFFDEIQNVEKWELFVRQMLDRKKHFAITGSNASLLSKELGTKLTGRHLRSELFPFSYREFLHFGGLKAGAESFEKYLSEGGFPEYLKYHKSEILQELLTDIIARDIAVKYKLRNPKIVKEMALYLLSNVGKEFSFNNLKKMFNLGSTNSAITFVSYFEDSYLLFVISKFEYSMRKQLANPKKVYSIDNGLSAVNSVSFSADKGRMLENATFLHLRRRHKDIYYFREKRECDFLVKEKSAITAVIQVCLELNESNKERELGGLLEALEKFHLKEGLLLTLEQEDELVVDGKRITIKPAWKWLLAEN